MIRRMVLRVTVKTMVIVFIAVVAITILFVVADRGQYSDCIRWHEGGCMLLVTAESIKNVDPFIAKALIGGILFLLISMACTYFFSEEYNPLRFYITFGYWPPKDTLLRKKLQEIVDEKMKLLAVDIRQHDEEEAAYQFKVGKGNIPYEEAVKELPKIRKIAKLYYGRFKKAQKIAEGAGFKVLDWRDYEKLDKEAYPPIDPFSTNL